jgi:hypothetical protein
MRQLVKSRLLIWLVLFLFTYSSVPQSGALLAAAASGLVAEAWAAEGEGNAPGVSTGYDGQPQFSIPIALSGSGKRLPQLALNYTSTRVGGWAGEGWDLDLPKLTQSEADGSSYTLTDGVRQELRWGWSGF